MRFLTRTAVSAAAIGAILLTTAGVTNVRAVGVFQPAQAQSWSANAGGVAAATYSAYRAVNGALSLASAGAVTHTLSDGDGSLQIAELKLASIKELANDVTVRILPCPSKPNRLGSLRATRRKRVPTMFGMP